MGLYDVEESRGIIIPRNDFEANSAVQRYIIDEDTAVIGLDCEWRTGPANYDVALIQIATEEHVILFQTCRFENENLLPRELADILRDKDIIKVGVNIEEDVRRIRLQFRESVLCWLDLRCFAIENLLLGENLLQQLEDYELKQSKENMSPADVKAKRVSFMPKLGLETLVANCLGKALPKAFASQVLGDWEAFQLTQELKLYAAADAAASLDVFHVLDSKIGHEYVTSNNSSLSSVIEKPYDHKKIRLSCLNMIAEVAPSWIQPILPHYYGRSYGRRSKVTLGFSPALQEQPLIDATSGIREEPGKLVEGGLFYYIRLLFEFIISGFVMILALIAILIFIGIIVKLMMDFRLLEKIREMSHLFLQKTGD